MALPNPHGNASGQIAHNSIYDTGVTPGSTGGKFIGFGEEGTSYIANRAHWALSENIDYVYQLMAADRAIPAGASFTSAGQSTYQIIDDVWVGDSGYPASEAEGLLMLFAVTDDQYNELTDGSGNEVRVAIVRDSTNVTNVYKNDTAPVDGFETDPVVTFKTVDSSGADVQNPYTIPAAQPVRVLYGSRSSFEALPTDALVKFKLQSATEVEAGAFLQDGTKKMTGDADWNEHRILNLLEARGAAGQDLLIRSLQSTRVNADENVSFNDQNTISDVFLSQASGGTQVEGFWNSILSSLNSKSAITGTFIGNRCLSRTGSLTFTGGTGAVAWPALTVVIDGERRFISAGSYTATNNGSVVFVAVVDSTGAVVERSPQSLQATDIPIAAYTWNGAAFTKSIDIRWAYNGTSRTLEITCGDGNCDFTGTELDKAINLASRLSYAVANGHVPRIRIIGAAYAPSAAPYNITLESPIEIVGSGPDQTILYSDETNGAGVDFINCAGYRIYVKDLSVLHAGLTQGATLGAFKNPGDNSIFENVLFGKDPSTNDIGFAHALIWTQAARNILVKNCRCVEVTTGFILGSDATFASTAYLEESVIEDCYLSGWGASASYGIVANGDGNILRNLELLTGLNDYGFVIGNDTLVDRCKVRMTGAAGSTPGAILYRPLAATTYHQSAIVRDSFFLRCDDGIQCPDITGIAARVLVRGCKFNQVDRPFNFSSIGTPLAASAVHITDNLINDTLEYAAFLTGAMDYYFANNVLTSIGGAGVVTGLASNVKIFGNDIEGYGSAGAYDNAIKVGYLGGYIQIENNRIRDVGAPASSTMIEIDWPCHISGNNLVGAGQADYGIRTIPSGIATFFTSIENQIIGNVFNFFQVGVRIAGNNNFTWNGTLIAHNRFDNFQSGDLGIEVDDAEGVVIDCNMFGGDTVYAPFIGRAIYIHGTSNGASGACCQIINNHFKQVAGAAGSAGAPRVVEVSGNGTTCHDILISGNMFQECGAFDVSHYPVGNNAAIIWVFGATNYQINNNHFRQMNGYSGSADNNDDFYCIYVGGAPARPGQINGNNFTHDFSIANFRADKMYGIYVSSTNYVQINGNYFNWYGTQVGANLTDVVVCIECNTNDYLMVSNNQSVGDWQIAGITGVNSRFIHIDGDYCACNGNHTYGSGGGGIHSIWFGSAGSGVGVAVGNVASGTETITWNTSTTNQPSTGAYSANGNSPYQDMNVGAVSHG